jgi:hypothetical protein
LQNELGKLVPGARLPTSTRAFNKYSHTARDNDRRRFDGGMGRGAAISTTCVFPAIHQNTIAGGKYAISVGDWADKIPVTGKAKWDECTDFSDPDDGLLLNQPEMDRDVTRVQGRIFVEWIGKYAENGWPVFVINYNFGLRGIRERDDGSCIEITTEDSDNPTYQCTNILLTSCDDTEPIAADMVLHSSGKSAETMLTDHEKVSEMSVLMYAQQFGELT